MVHLSKQLQENKHNNKVKIIVQKNWGYEDCKTYYCEIEYVVDTSDCRKMEQTYFSLSLLLSVTKTLDTTCKQTQADAERWREDAPLL